MAFDDQDQQVDLDAWEKRVFEKHGVPEGLRMSIRNQESGGDVNATSPTGVKGRYQVTQKTAANFGLNRDDPWEQPVAAARLLRQGYDDAKRKNPKFSDRQAWLASSASYYAGPDAFDADGNLSAGSKDGLSNPSRYAESIAQKWADFERGSQSAQPALQPEPSTLRKAIVPGRQQTTVRGPMRPSAPNPFALTGPTGFEQAGQQVAARTAQISPEVAAQADRRAARIEAERRRYSQKGVIGQRVEDIGEGLAGVGESAQRGFENVLSATGIRKGLSYTSPSAKAALERGQLAQVHTAQRMGERVQAADSLASKTTRALTSGAVGATTMIPVAMAGGIPAVMAATGLQQDWSDPKAAALNTALSGLPIAAGRAISPAASRVAGRAFTAPVAQEAARRGIEAGAGGVTNVGQYAGTQALLGRPVDPEEALAQGVAGGVLGTAMAPGRRQAAAMARPRSPIDIPVYDDVGDISGYDRVDAPLTPDVVGQGVNRAGDLGATVQRAGDIRPRPRGTAPMPIQNRLASLTPAPDTPATTAMPPLGPTQIPAQPASNPLAILQENANEAKINAAQFEQSGDWESAQREYDVAHKTLVEAQRQMKRVRNQTPEQADALSAIAREISGAALNRNRASRSATVARREQGIAGRQARKSQNAVENAPTADLPAETNPLLKSVVNPEGGIPESAPESPSGLFGQLGRQQAVEQAKPQRGPKDSRQLSAAEYLKRATNGEGVRVSDRGEARVLGAKEAGIIGLTNRASKYAVSDAQVMLDEGGFSLQDGRKFTDPSVTENDVLAFLAESGREGRMNTRDLDQRIEREAAEYYENQPTGEVRLASNRLPRIGDLPPSRMAGLQPERPEIPRETSRPLTVAEQARQAGGSTDDLAILDRLNQRLAVEEPRPYGERTRHGEPGSGGRSLSPYADLIRDNRGAFDQLEKMNLESPEAGEILARIDDYVERKGIDPIHLVRKLNSIRSNQAGEARRADEGVGSAPLRQTPSEELRDFFSRPDEAPPKSEPLRPVRLARPAEMAPISRKEAVPVTPEPQPSARGNVASNVADTIAEDLRRLHAMNPQEIEQALRAAEARRNDDIRDPQMNEVERRMNRQVIQLANKRRKILVKAKQLPPKFKRGPARGVADPFEDDPTGLPDDVLARRIQEAERALDSGHVLGSRASEIEDFLNVAEREQERRQGARTVSHPDPAIDGQLVLATTADGRVIVANEGNKSGVSVVKDRLTTEPKPDRAPVKYAIPDEAMPELNPNRERGDVFYSQLERVIDQKMPARASSAQVRAMVGNPQSGVKADEIKWTGLDDFLRSKGEVTRAEVQEFLKANRVEVKEVVKRDHGLGAKFGQYTLPGAKERSYRELLLTMPLARAEDVPNYRTYARERGYSDDRVKETWQTDDPLYREWESKNDQRGKPLKPEFKSSHFDEPNILAHLRFNERTDADGNRVMHVEEIQSDWHQEGRKKGYRGEPGAVEFGAVPNAPFKKTWHELAFKRALRYAAENDYDRMTWTTGEQQAERFDLSKQVKEIEYIKHGDQYELGVTSINGDGVKLPKDRFTADELEDVVGKEIAQKIVNGEGKKYRGHDGYSLDGLDLKVGGEGMKGFYDQILPAFANKYAKKWGARVGEAKIEISANTDRTGAFPKTESVHSIDITPAMRESVMGGQPMFQRGNQPLPMPDRVTARDLADNVRAEYRPAANRPGTVYLNDWGLEALNAADYLEFRAGREGAADDRITGGVNYPPEEARQIADHIRERAGRPNFSDEGRKNLETMARQIELAADDGNVSFVPMQGQTMRQARQTIRHEAFHSQQSAVHPDVHELTTPRWLRAQRFGAAIGEELSRRGYSERQHPAEAAAFVASGNWDAFGMNRDDAREFLTEYFDNVAYRHGKEAINKFRAIHPALQEVVEARRGTNEPRFGSPGLGRSIGSAVNRQRGVERPGGSVARSRGSVPSGDAGSVRGQSQTAALRAITPESLRAGQPAESAPAQSPRRQGLAGIRAEDLRAEGGGGRASRAPREPVSGAPVGKDISGWDYIRSPLSNLNFKGTYERLAGDRGRDVSEIIRNAQVEIARKPDTERAAMVSDLRKQLRPLKEEFRDNGQPGLANWLDEHVNALSDPDAAFKGLAGFLRGFHYNMKLRYNPKSAALNWMQPLQTLWPHVTTREFASLMKDARTPSIRRRVLEIAERESGGQVDEVSKKGRFEAVPKIIRNPFGIVSDTNRVMGHLAGEMFADRLGLSGDAKARMAADWAKKIEYDNSRWDVPPLFRGKIAGVAGQFKPFTIKNIERLYSDWKAAPIEELATNTWKGSGTLARRAKMIAGQVAIGGVRSVPGVKTIGGVLLLGALANAFNKAGLPPDEADKAAEMVYFGAPGLVEQDLSSSSMILDAPFGNTPAEQAVNFFGGPTGSLIVKAFQEGGTMYDAKSGQGSTAADKRKAAGIRLAKAVTPYSKTVEAAADLAQGKRPALKMERRQVPMTNLEVAGKLGMGTPLRQSKFYDEKDAFEWQKRAERKLRPARP